MGWVGVDVDGGYDYGGVCGVLVVDVVVFVDDEG